MKALLIVLVLLVLIMVFVMPMVADLSQRAAVTDKVKAEVSLTTALADKASAETRKLNAEAHRLENELDRDKIGWTGVMVKESGVGALGSIAFVIAFVFIVGGLCLAIVIMLRPGSWKT